MSTEADNKWQLPRDFPQGFMQLWEDARLMPDKETRQGGEEATGWAVVEIGSLDLAAAGFRWLRG